MKIVTVVGIRASGKTSLIEVLVRELTARGKKVGTVKTVFCPTFHMDKPGSNTYRHTRAGAGLVTVRAEGETSLLFPRKMSPSEVYENYCGFDWVLAEGDYQLPAARIVTAHREEDARERVNPMTLAFSGKLADSRQELYGLKVYHYERDISALCDLMEEKVEDTEDPEKLDESLNGEDLALSRAYCAVGCRGHREKKEGVRVTVDGVPLSLSPEQEKTLRLWAGKE
ncbi:MAG: molybdopterin-guanine dinucleotide biosynthesis protein B [Clostridia bacterium]|nr:molybdopterin-guanine dinucleotide biosynthesis protein B [Clostridia bacterium]